LSGAALLTGAGAYLLNKKSASKSEGSPLLNKTNLAIIGAAGAGYAAYKHLSKKKHSDSRDGSSPTSSSSDDNRSKSRSGKSREEEEGGPLWAWMIALLIPLIVLGLLLNSLEFDSDDNPARRESRDVMLMLEE